MAKITFKKSSEYFAKLQALEREAEGREFLKKAVRKGAEPVADAIRQRLEQLPQQVFQRLPAGDIFTGISNSQKEDLLNGFGLAPILINRYGFIHTKAGFEGYGSFPTPTYPEGVPNQLLAASVESGSTVRKKTPFLAPAVRESRKAAIAAMEAVIDQSMEDIFEGG